MLEQQRRINADEPTDNTMTDKERRLQVDLERTEVKFAQAEKNAKEWQSRYNEKQKDIEALEAEYKKLLTDLHRHDTELEYFRSRTAMLEQENSSLRFDNESLSIRCREHEGYIRGIELAWNKIDSGNKP